MKGKYKKNSKNAIDARKDPRYRHGRHCIFLMHVHLVFVTKYRRMCFTNRVLEHLELVMKEVCCKFESELVEFNGEQDHVHLLVNYPPKHSISKIVNSLKGISARHIRSGNYPEIRKKLWGKKLWSPSYFAASCGGGSLEIIKKYIDDQGA